MRKEKGITQEQLAAVLCISAGAVSKWETNSSIPDIAMLPKIANFFGVSIDLLFDFTLTESETPENILKKVKELSVGFNYNESIVKYDDIKIVFDCDEIISILTGACIKFPNNYELKAELYWYKHLEASKYNVKDPEIYKKAEREILNELYTITKLTTDRNITDRCYSLITQIHFILEEYDKAEEIATKYSCKNDFQLIYNQSLLSSLIKQNKIEEAEKHAHNSTYISLIQIYVNLTSFQVAKMYDIEKIIKVNLAIINLCKIFSDDSPGPFDFSIASSYLCLGFCYYGMREFEESVKCFEEVYNYSERLKIFSETREITSDFIKYTDKKRLMYNAPFDYRQAIFSAFDAMKEEPEYLEFKEREDFQKFIEKIKQS